MKRRLVLWTLIGIGVACCWFLIGLITGPQFGRFLGNSIIVAITAPASILGRAMPLKYYWFILLNGAAYALLGLATELFRPARVR